jgi:hypothetical protein
LNYLILLNPKHIFERLLSYLKQYFYLYPFRSPRFDSSVNPQVFPLVISSWSQMNLALNSIILDMASQKIENHSNVSHRQRVNNVLRVNNQINFGIQLVDWLVNNFHRHKGYNFTFLILYIVLNNQTFSILLHGRKQSFFVFNLFFIKSCKNL